MKDLQCPNSPKPFHCESAGDDRSCSRSVAHQAEGGAAGPAAGIDLAQQNLSNAAQESERMRVFATADVSSNTRHARRIYVGGIPPNHADEEELCNFLNEAISRGMGEENDHSYVLSVYMNHKKCYAFVELKSIELTTACMDLDGVIFKKIVLKILRANEYRADLVSEDAQIKLDLSSFSFSTPAVLSNSSSQDNSENAFSRASSKREILLPASDCLASLIQFTNVTGMELGSVSIVGFPYAESAGAATATAAAAGRASGYAPAAMGPSASPRALRTSMSLYRHGAVQNSEYGIDLTAVKFMDVGDVLAGKTMEETKAILSTTVTELISRGSVPFVVGGTMDQSYYTALGLIGAAGCSVGVMSVSAQIDHRLLLHDSFCAPLGPAPASCDGRYVCFGAQGSQCVHEAARVTVDRGGKIVWLTKDLRTPTAASVAVPQYLKHLRALSRCVRGNPAAGATAGAAADERSLDGSCSGTGSVHGGGGSTFSQASAGGVAAGCMMVTLDASVLCNVHSPLCNASSSTIGLTLEEVLEIAFISGAHPNVALFEVTGFSPEAEESRANLVLADILYRFSLGVATRQTHTANQRSGAAPVAAAAAAPQPSGIAQQGQGQGQVPPTPDGAGYVRSASSDSLYSPSLYSDSANLSHETLDWERSRDFGRAVSSSASASASASSSGSGSGSGFGSSFAATPSVYPPTNPAGQSYAHPASASGGSNAYPSQMRGSPQQDRARSPMVGGVGAVARYNNSSQAKNEYLRPGGQVSEGHGEDVGVSFRSQQHSQTSRFNQQLPHHQQQQLHHQQQQYRSGQVMYKNQTQQSAALPHQGLPHGGYAINPNTRQPLVADMQAAKPLPSFSQWSGHTQPAPRQGFRVQEQGLPHQSALVGGQRFASSASMSMQRDAQHFASRGMAPMTASTMPGENDHAQDIASLQSCSYHNFMDGQHQQPQYRNAQAAPHMSNPANASKYSSLHSSSSNGYTTNSSMSASFSGKYGQQHSPAPIGSNTKNAGSENNLFHMMNAGSESSLFHTRNATGDFGIGNHFDFGGILGPPPSLQEPLHSRGGGNNFDADDLGVKGLGHVSYFDD